MRRLLLAAALFVTIPSSPAFASSITINWTGNYVGFYNGDYFGLCKVDPTACFYGDILATYGIDTWQGGGAPNPWQLSMTFADATGVAYPFFPDMTVFNTTVDVHFEIGKFAAHDYNLPVSFANAHLGLGNPVWTHGTEGNFQFSTRFATSMWGGRTSGSAFNTYIANMPSPGTSLVAFLQQQPLQSLSLSGACISVSGMDCDFMLSSETVSVSVPEASTLISLSGALFGFVAWRHRTASRQG